MKKKKEWKTRFGDPIETDEDCEEDLMGHGKNTSHLDISYEKYVKDGGKNTFGVWCLETVTDAQLRPALLIKKEKNREFLEADGGRVWTPQGRKHLNPEYLKRGTELRALQKAQREADPDWMALDSLGKGLRKWSDQGLPALTKEEISKFEEFYKKKDSRDWKARFYHWLKKNEADLKRFLTLAALLLVVIALVYKMLVAGYALFYINTDTVRMP